MEKIRLTGRASRLSLLQIELVAKKIRAAFPGMEVEITPRTSRGDELQDRPLQLEEGSDFFTQDIFDALANNEADIAVHSLKDMSGGHFFGSNYFVVTERDDVRDVAIFNPDVRQKISRGEEIVIGTCSPRREEMATVFLKRALPQLSDNFSVITRSIRGNVDSRLRKLSSGEYDGIILATAGLNRLLNSEVDREVVGELLLDKLLMILPIIECVPAPCQGAIVAEAHLSNKRAIEILARIGDEELLQDCVREKSVALSYGTGCLQKFGVATIPYDHKKIVYAAGRNESGGLFNRWFELPACEIDNSEVFNSTVYMGSFFSYEYLNNAAILEKPVVYISNYKAVHDESLIDQLNSKKIWAAGTKTWFELASKGIWVEGCADALGLESLNEIWAMPLLKINISNVTIITNDQSAERWKRKGWHAVGTYRTIEKKTAEVSEQVKKSDLLFWTSFRQYEQYKGEIRRSAIHACAAGETAELLRANGIEPIVFPTIKSFQGWKKSSTRSHNAA